MTGPPAGAGHDNPSHDAAPKRRRQQHSPAEVAKRLAIGFAMGSADVVPGVSGGTVALVGGVYTRLVDAIRDVADAGVTILRGRFGDGAARLRRADWALLVPLAVGILVAVVSLASVLERQLEEHPVRVAGLFFGLVAGSLVIVAQMLRRIDTTTMVTIAVVAVAVFLLLGLRSETTGEAGAAATAPLWAYPLAAAIAICAMILPGVSGSFLLVMMGMYAHVLAAVNDRDVGVVLLFLVGAVIGLAAFSRLLSRLMHRHHDRVIAVMMGLMLGSVRVLWPWPHGTGSTTLALPRGDVGLPLVLMLVGAAAVIAIGALGALREE